jgi:hypothetical protein
MAAPTKRRVTRDARRSTEESKRLAERHALRRAIQHTRDINDLGRKLLKAIEIADAIIKVLREVLAARDSALEPVRARYAPNEPASR